MSFIKYTDIFINTSIFTVYFCLFTLNNLYCSLYKNKQCLWVFVWFLGQFMSVGSLMTVLRLNEVDCFICMLMGGGGVSCFYFNVKVGLPLLSGQQMWRAGWSSGVQLRHLSVSSWWWCVAMATEVIVCTGQKTVLSPVSPLEASAVTHSWLSINYCYK